MSCRRGLFAIGILGRISGKVRGVGGREGGTEGRTALVSEACLEGYAAAGCGGKGEDGKQCG